jgi:hypothetical protein
MSNTSSLPIVGRVVVKTSMMGHPGKEGNDCLYLIIISTAVLQIESEASCNSSNEYVRHLKIGSVQRLIRHSTVAAEELLPRMVLDWCRVLLQC